jgi:HK97 family phage major capsid protein
MTLHQKQRGLVTAVRAETSEVKALTEKLMQTVASFKEENDKALNDLRRGQEDVVRTEKVDRINSAIDEIRDQIKEVASRAAAAELTGSRDGVDFAKAAKELSVQAGIAELSVDDYKSYVRGLDVYMRRGDARDIRAAMSVGSDPDGGYTVTPDTSGRMIKKIYESSPMRQMASVITISTDRIEGPIDRGEGTAGWVGESSPRPTTATPQLGKWEIPVHEMYDFPETTQRLLDDSSVNIEAWLADKTSDKFARTETTAFFTGDGVNKPRGILDYSTAATADSSRAWEVWEHVATGTSAGFGTAPNGSDKLIDLVYKLKPSYRQGSRWAMSRSTLAAVRKLKDGDGNYLWVPTINAFETGNLIGFPVMECEDMPTVGADSLSIAFGNFAEAYTIVDRTGIRVLRDALTNKPYIGFYTTRRVGGGALDFEALKFLKFSTT